MTIIIGLSDAEHQARRLGIGGSDVATILGGDPKALYQLYLEKIGEAKPRKIMSDWDRAIRHVTETLQLDWYEHMNPGTQVNMRGEVVVSANRPFMRCTLDGFIPKLGVPINAKHLSGWTKQAEEWAIEHYTGQVTHEALVCDAPHGLISLMVGEKEPVIIKVEVDPFFAEDLIEKEAAFWRCVETKTPPEGCEALAAPKVAVEVAKLRKIALTGNPDQPGTVRNWPNWAFEAEPLIRSFIATEAASKRHAIVREEIKALVPDDVGELRRGDFVLTRTRANAITMKTVKEEDDA